MRVGQIIERVPGFSRVADRALYWSMICRTAEERYKILAFWDRHGLAATQDAYDLSRRTLYVWRAKLARRARRDHSECVAGCGPRRW